MRSFAHWRTGADDTDRDPDGVRAARLLERMNSPLENRKVRLRGL
jgi:hypothetical protein